MVDPMQIFRLALQLSRKRSYLFSHELAFGGRRGSIIRVWQIDAIQMRPFYLHSHCLCICVASLQIDRNRLNSLFDDKKDER